MNQISETLNKMPAPSLEHQPPASKPLRTGDETKLIEAVKMKKLQDSPVDDLEAVLRYAMLKVGLRAISLPNGEEIGILLTHIMDNYGTHSPQEVRLAFDMAIAGKLDVDPQCYENFSCLYFSTIMNAYRRWAAKVQDYVLREKQPVNEKQLGYQVHWGGEINTAYQAICAGKFISYITFPVQFYDQLCKDGFINHNPLYSVDQKKKAVFELFEREKEKKRKVFYER